MKKQLVLGLVSAGLLVAMLPGMTVAKDKVDTSACKRGGWADWAREDGSMFADQAQCVAYVAEGGTLVSTFQSVCQSEGGQYWTDIVWKEAYVVTEACSWHVVDHETIQAHFEAVGPYCRRELGTYDDADPLGDGWLLCGWTELTGAA